MMCRGCLQPIQHCHTGCEGWRHLNGYHHADRPTVHPARPRVPDIADVGPGYEWYRERREAMGLDPWTGVAA